MEFSFYALRQLFHTAYAHPQKVPVILDNQAWTYSELVVQVRRVVYHLHRLNIIHGQIIYQFLERGFEMVCGLIDIMWAGSIYCPLNPSDPSKRICSILEQIQGQYVLLSEKIRNEFSTAIVKRMILFEQIMSPLPFIEDMHDLPHCRECGAVYIICTSDTTGRQNAAVSTHKSFAANIRAFSPWHLGVYMSRDQVLQIANCSWVLHLREIPLSLASDGTLISLDMANLSQILLCQQVTTLFIGPGIIRPFTSYMEMSQQLETFNLVSNLVVKGNFEVFIYSRNCVIFCLF
jgi:non-ribosomal peptide synthetase component F